MEPSQLGSLKGLNGTKDTRGFILVRPLMVKVRPTSSWVAIDVSMTRERDTLCLALDELFLASAASGSSPYIHGSTPCVLQSPGRLINNVRLGD